MDNENDNSRILKKFTLKTNKKTLHVNIVDPRTIYTPEQLEENRKKFDCALEMSINDVLYKKGHISKQMYEKAKDLILKQVDNIGE